MNITYLDTETLEGTSYCKETECLDCLTGLKCSTIHLLEEMKAISEISGYPLEPIFPSLPFHLMITLGRKS